MKGARVEQPEDETKRAIDALINKHRLNVRAERFEEAKANLRQAMDIAIESGNTEKIDEIKALQKELDETNRPKRTFG